MDKFVENMMFDYTDEYGLKICINNNGLAVQNSDRDG